MTVLAQAPQVSVVILNYNGRRHLGKILDGCLASVLATDYPNFEVLFVDNASSDDSVGYVEAKFGEDKRLRFVRNERNMGFTGGNNVGIRNARGEYVVLLNTDTKVDPLWLHALVKAAQTSAVGAVQSKLVQMGNPQLLDCAGGFVDTYGYHFERGRGENVSKYRKVDEIFYAKGAGVLLKRAALGQTGLFDPDLFMYFDETDLCWRLRLAGYKVLFASESVVYHAAGLTASNVGLRNRLYLHVRNHLLVVLKNYNLANASKVAAVSVLYELRNSLLFLARRKPLVSFAIVQAVFWNIQHLQETWKKRLAVQKNVRKVSDERIQKAMLKPVPPFPLYLVFSRFRYMRNRENINTLDGDT